MIIRSIKLNLNIEFDFKQIGKAPTIPSPFSLQIKTMPGFGEGIAQENRFLESRSRQYGEISVCNQTDINTSQRRQQLIATGNQRIAITASNG